MGTPAPHSVSGPKFVIGIKTLGTPPTFFEKAGRITRLVNTFLARAQGALTGKSEKGNPLGAGSLSEQMDKLLKQATEQQKSLFFVRNLSCFQKGDDPTYEKAKSSLMGINENAGEIKKALDKMPDTGKGYIAIPIVTPPPTGTPLKAARAALIAATPLLLALSLIEQVVIAPIAHLVNRISGNTFPSYKDLCSLKMRMTSFKEKYNNPLIGHITNLLIEVDKGSKTATIEFFDSKGNPMDHPDHKFKGSEETIRDLVESVIVPAMSNNFKRVEAYQHRTQHQRDVHNCGFYVLWHVQQRVMEGKSIQAIAQTKHLHKEIEQKRLEFAKTILSSPASFDNSNNDWQNDS